MHVGNICLSSCIPTTDVPFKRMSDSWLSTAICWYPCTPKASHLTFDISPMTSTGFERMFSNEGDAFGYPSFLKIDELNDSEDGFLEDGWLTLAVRISVDHLAEHDRTAGAGTEDALCVFCHIKQQTSGFVHGTTYINRSSQLTSSNSV